MSNTFGKRVDILTDWHNKMPDANVDLLAEMVLDVWNKAEEHTKNSIEINIMSRVTDLNSCGKNDNCAEFGDLIESYIEEWLE